MAVLKEFGHLYHDDIRSEAERRFGLKRSDSTPLQGSHSYVYEYPGGEQSVILKITHSSHRRERQILGELDFTNYLADNGVRVSRAVMSLGGSSVEIMEAESGYFLATAYRESVGRAGGLARVDTGAV